MTKVKVISTFCDKYTGKYHYPGELLEVDDERVDELQSRGLAERIETKKKGVKRPPENRMVEEAENR